MPRSLLPRVVRTPANGKPAKGAAAKGARASDQPARADSASGDAARGRGAGGLRWRQAVGGSLRFVVRGLSELCYPPACVLCHGPLEGQETAGPTAAGSTAAGQAIPEGPRSLCRECLATLLATVPEAACDRCGRPQPPVVVGSGVAGGSGVASGSGVPVCARCRKRPSEITRCVALGMYRDVMREAVVAAKRTSYQPLALALGELLGRRIERMWGRAAIGAVTFVPSHWTRRWGRGGCPAQLLAHQVGRSIGAPVLPILRARRRTAKQGTLDDNRRRTNVCGAFGAKKGYALLSPRVLVVDDVWTTGATLEEAARVIRQGYDAEVFAAVIARAIGTHDG